MDIPNRFFSVVIPINPAGEILMGRRVEDDLWTTPAGGSEGNETPVECAIREAHEEALLEIVPSQLEFLYEKRTPKEEPVYIYLFRCGQQYTDPKYDPDKEVKLWEWLDPPNFPKDFYDKKQKLRTSSMLDALSLFHTFHKSHKVNELFGFIHEVSEDFPKLSQDVYKKLRSIYNMRKSDNSIYFNKELLPNYDTLNDKLLLGGLNGSKSRD